MIGISAYGAYVPATRLPLALAAGRPAKNGEPERAVAAHDEDALTMAVAAAMDCLHGSDRDEIDALYLATTTSPYREKSGAALVAKALALRRDAATLELGGCLRARRFSGWRLQRFQERHFQRQTGHPVGFVIHRLGKNPHQAQ